jgi:hypothetical protein
VTDLSRHILQTTVSWFYSITTFLPMSNPYQAFEDFLASIGVPVTDANRDAFAAFYQQQNAGHAQDPSHSSPFDINAFAQAFASAIPQPIPIDYSALSQALITGQRASQASEVPMEKMQPWGGDRDKLDEFISQCELRFLAKPFKYATAEAQILFASGVLVDTPRKLVDQERSLAPPLQSPWLHSWPAFTGQLRAWFGDADPRATARNKLSALRQTTSVLGYWTDFAVLAVKLPWGDEAKTDAFYVGLKPEIKDELARLPVSPVTLLDLKEHAVRIDTRLYQRHFERTHEDRHLDTISNGRNTNTTTQHTVLTNNTHYAPPGESLSDQYTSPGFDSGPQPMDVDAVFQGKVTPAEKDRRRRFGLCAYDGCTQPGNCKKLKAKDANASANGIIYSVSGSKPSSSD